MKFIMRKTKAPFNLNMIKICGFLVALYMSAYSTPTYALYSDCTSSQLPLSLSIPNVRILSNLPVGTTIPGTVKPFSVSTTCTNTFSVGQIWLLTSSSSGTASTTSFSNVYKLSNDIGIGFMIRDRNGNPIPNTTYGGGISFNLYQGISNGVNIIDGSIELVKISSTIKIGTQTGTFFMHVSGSEYANGGSAANSLVTLNFTITQPMVPTCSILMPTQQITLPTVAQSAFKGNNSTAAPKGFNIGFQCEPNVDATLSFTDNTTPTNTTSNLSLTGSSANNAGGVLLQLLYSGMPVTFGPDGSGTATSIPVKNSGSSQAINIPMIVRYIQNGGAVSPGDVNAITTYTLTYK
jgi:type 1 fimbria pilin